MTTCGSCGSGGASYNPGHIPKVKPVFFPGEEGFTLVMYEGQAPGVRSWPGPVTRARYRFGRGKVVGYMDTRDVRVFSRAESSPFVEVALEISSEEVAEKREG